MADELQTKRIIELAQKTAPEEGDNLAVDNATSGTRRILWENLLDNSLSDDTKAAPAGVTGQAIEDAKTTFTDLNEGNVVINYDEDEPDGPDTPLRSIRFPLLPYRYTVPVIDNTITQSGQAAAADVVGNRFSSITKPSRNLYQLDPTYSASLGGITVKASLNEVSVVGTATSNVSFVLPTVFEMVANQKYTFSGCPSGGGANTYRLDLRNEDSDSLASTLVYDFGDGAVGYSTTAKRIRLGIRIVSGTTINAVFKPMILKGEMLGTSFIPYLTAYDDIARATNDKQDASIENINATVSNIDTDLKNATGYNLNYGRNVLTFVPGTDGSTIAGMLDNSFSYVIFNWLQDLGSDFPLSPTATGFLYKFGNRTQSGAGAVKLLIAIDTNGNTAKGKITGSGVIQWFSGGALGITVAMFGDSITWGRDGASSSAVQVSTTIPMVVHEMLGVNTINYGVGSQGWMTTQFISTTALDNIASKDLSTVDVVTLAYGINDSDSPLGTYTDIGTSTIMGCIYNALQEIYDQNPLATIILVAPFGSVTSGTAPVWLDNTARPGGWTLTEMREEYRKLAEYYHLPYISCADAPINRFTPRDMLPDGIHPNQQAYIILGRYIAGQIGSFIG